MEHEENKAPDPASQMGEAEKAEALKRRLFTWHKNQGTLAVYYYLYPLDRPVNWFRQQEREQGQGQEQNHDRGRER